MFSNSASDSIFTSSAHTPRTRKTSKIYPSLPSYINETQIPTLCMACSCPITQCPWFYSSEPTPDWEAIPTIVHDAVKDYTSYKVISCPRFILTPEYHSNSGDFIRLMATYASVNETTVNNHLESFVKAYEEYSALYPRTNLDLTSEFRQQAFCEILKKYYVKSKNKKHNRRKSK